MLIFQNIYHLIFGTGESDCEGTCLELVFLTYIFPKTTYEIIFSFKHFLNMLVQYSNMFLFLSFIWKIFVLHLQCFYYIQFWKNLYFIVILPKILWFSWVAEELFGSTWGTKKFVQHYWIWRIEIFFADLSPFCILISIPFLSLRDFAG